MDAMHPLQYLVGYASTSRFNSTYSIMGITTICYEDIRNS